MELIIGGRAQGKLAYVLNRSGLSQQQVSDAMIEDKPIINGLHRYIYEKLQENSDITVDEILKEVKEFVLRCPKGYIICDEVGSGIVPMNPTDRAYRELVGRVLCEVTKLSTCVTRVFCGIGVRIKDVKNHTDPSWTDKR